MLNKKQVQFLKKEAHHLKPIFQIGKGGMNEDMIKQIEEALDKRELIKVTLLQNTLLDNEDVVDIIKEHTSIHIIQVIGHTLVLYKVSSKEKYRRLSNDVKKIK